jgi:hypothetical protein
LQWTSHAITVHLWCALTDDFWSLLQQVIDCAKMAPNIGGNMSTDLDPVAKALSDAEAELSNIEQRLAEVEPLRLRRETLRSWVSLTRQVYPGLTDAVAPSTPAPAPTIIQSGVLLRTREPQKDRVAAVAAQIIREEGSMISRMLAERLEARGVTIGGTDKASTVSSILSRNDAFTSNRSAGGWVLVQPHKEATPPGAPTPAGS